MAYFLKENNRRNLDLCVNIPLEYYFYSDVIGRSDDIELGLDKKNCHSNKSYGINCLID